MKTLWKNVEAFTSNLFHTHTHHPLCQMIEEDLNEGKINILLKNNDYSELVIEGWKVKKESNTLNI
jgi:hypothetical protein